MDDFERLMKQLTALVGSPGEDLLRIEDYYQEGDGSKFEPFAEGIPMIGSDMAFEALDRKTQFFTLFAEWSRREADGLMVMTRGDLTGAETVFRECVDRAKQIQVAELCARSYEDLARVAERRGDQNGVLSWLEQAEKARSAGCGQ